MKLKIEVTNKHIKEGKSSDCYICPIALAVTEHINTDYAEVHVMHRELTFLPLYGRQTVKILPYSARDFINDFDAGKDVKPFSFEMFIPNRYLNKRGNSK